MADNAMQETLQDVLDSIIAERGGLNSFDVKSVLAARGLVRLMSALNNDDTSKRGGIAALEAMLPPRPAPPKLAEKLEIEFVPMLSKLSDAELATLQAIFCKMNDTTPEGATPEQLALQALREENERLRRDIDGLTEHYSGIIRQ